MWSLSSIFKLSTAKMGFFPGNHIILIQKNTGLCKCPIINLFLSCTIPLAALRPAHGSRGFKRGCPFAQMGVFSGGVPLRQENALLSYGFSVQNSHWSRNHLHAQGCASLSRWNGLLNRLYLVYRLFGFNSAQIVVQVFVLTVQVGCIPHMVAEGSLDGKRCLPPSLVVVEQTTDALVAV